MPVLPDLNGPVAANATNQALFNLAFEGNSTALSNGSVATARDTGGGTPLHWLAVRDVVAILQETAMATVTNHDGDMPIHLLAERGHVEVLQYAAVSTAKGQGGWTALRRLADSVSAANVATLVTYLNGTGSDPENNMAILKARGLV